MILAAALGVLLLFATLAFAATEQWALAIVQCGIFALSSWCVLKGRLQFRAIALAPVGVVGLGALQLAAGITVYPFATKNAIVDWAAYTALFLVSAHVFSNAAMLGKARRAALYAGLMVAILSTAQYFTSNGEIYWMFPVRAGRPFGPFVNPDHYAAFIELIIPLGLYEAFYDRARTWLYAGIVGVLYGSVIASASRAGVGLATFEILAVPLLARRPVRILPVLAGFAAIGTAVAGGSVVWQRFLEKNPLQYRLDIYKSTLQMIKQRPWVGFGLGTYAVVYPQFASFDIGLTVDHAHNDWGEWTTEGGIPMLLIAASSAVASFRRAIRRSWGLGVHAVLLHSLIDFPLQIPAIGFLTSAILGALYADTHKRCSTLVRETIDLFDRKAA